jgi:hypothetical protein
MPEREPLGSRGKSGETEQGNNGSLKGDFFKRRFDGNKIYSTIKD